MDTSMMSVNQHSIQYVAYHVAGSIDRRAVAAFVNFNQGELAAEFVEGRRKWPQLLLAIEKCKDIGGILVLSKLGRLVRNPKFLTILQQSGIDFACLDIQNCNRFTVHILIATAEEESARISERTKRALAVAVKEKGIKLGSARPGHWKGREHLRGTRKAIAKSAELRRSRTKQTYQFLLPDLQRLREEGRTMDEIAVWLNDHGHMTTAGKPFNQVSVWRLLDRYLGKDYLGAVRNRGGEPLVIACMEKK